MTIDADKDIDNTDEKEHSGKQMFGHEAILELVENEAGQIVLRDVNHTDEPLVTIDFSAKVQHMLGSDAQSIGQHMIHAAIQAVMHKQMSQWHANVYDEEPEHYS